MNKPRKILILSLDYYPGDVGGAEIAIKEITDRIEPAEIEFHLLTMRYDSALGRTEQIGNVLVHRIGFGKKQPTIEQRRSFPLHLNKYFFQMTAALKAWQLHRRYHYDGLWAMMAHSCGVPAALFKLFHPQVKFILTLQEGDPPEHIERKARLVWPLFQRAFTSADTVQVISTFLGAWAERMGYQGKPVLVPNAVDVERFSLPVSEDKRSAIHKEWNKKLDDIILITTSRLVAKNAIDTVVQAMAALPERVHFVVYGDGPEREKLEALTRTLNLSDRVHLQGLIGHEVIPQYLQAADIFIRPSRSEGMGNSFVEAMACGLPVIATQVGGIADFLFDAKLNPTQPTTGWAVAVDQPDQIVTAVHDIIDNQNQTQQVIKTARELVGRKYTWPVVAKKMQSEVFGFE